MQNKTQKIDTAGNQDQKKVITAPTFKKGKYSGDGERAAHVRHSLDYRPVDRCDPSTADRAA